MTKNRHVGLYHASPVSRSLFHSKLASMCLPAGLRYTRKTRFGVRVGVKTSAYTALVGSKGGSVVIGGG